MVTAHVMPHLRGERSAREGLGIPEPTRSRRQFIATAAAAAAAWPAAARGDSGVVRVALETDFGTVVLVIEATNAPISAKQFLAYVDSNSFNGALFRRAVHKDRDPAPVKIDVLQAAVDVKRRLGPIPHEPTTLTGLRHLDGTVSVARREVGTGNAGDFFVCIGDQPSLDYGGARNPDGQGFAAFGRVISGMDIIQRIWNGATVASRYSPQIADQLTAPVPILSARRIFPGYECAPDGVDLGCD